MGDPKCSEHARPIMPAWPVSKSEDSVCFILLACLRSQLLLKVTYLCPCTTLGFTARIFDIASRPRYFTTKENQCSQSIKGNVTSQI